MLRNHKSKNMKNLFFVFAFACLTNLGFTQEKGIDITITIDNVVNDEGKVLISLHTADTFMKGPGVANLESIIKDGKVELTFKNVEPGTYAIMAMHDANNNKQMDFQSNGMPIESYGMYGNDMSFGPPSFDSAKFEVNGEDLEMNIRF